MKPTRSLRWRLVAIVALLLVATNIVVGAVTVIALHGYLLNQVDQNLAVASHRALSSRGELPPHAGQNGAQPGETPRIPDHTFVGAPGQSANTVVAIIKDGTFVVQGFIDEQGKQHALTPTAQAQLKALPSDAKPHTEDLDGLGTYRIVSTKTPDGTVFITGLPLAPLEATIDQLVLVIAIVAIVGLVIAVAAGAIIVRRALRPLQHVAATASAVTELTLDRGEVPETMRVSDSDIHTGSEVGAVGIALNRLLGHVSNALTVREAAEKKVRTFVADASHELRTPLATIRAYAELSQRDLSGASDGLKRNVDRIESEAVRMTSMVDDLLLLARLDSEPKTDFTQVDLSRIVAEAVMDAHAAAPGHVWSVDLSDDLVIVPGVESQLRQAVVNLVANARTHTPTGTAVAVKLQQAPDGSVLLQVSDDGPGIRPELQPALFERFVRGDDTRFRGAGSTGLGLSIVHAVVEAHGGTVGVESEPGHTVFSIELPPSALA